MDIINPIKYHLIINALNKKINKRLVVSGKPDTTFYLIITL